jgi:hypothetical protein
VEFKDPPKGRKPSPYWIDVVAALKASPRTWALVGDYSVAVASHIRAGSYPAFVPKNIEDKREYMRKNYEVRSVKRPDDRWDVFIQYIGAKKK